MNFLAHLLLSGDNPEIQFGNFVGDAIKGKQYLTLPINIQKGVLLHRKIDTFTDQNTLIKDCKKKLSDELGHYRGVITDVIFDHFLTLKWANYHKKNLTDFIEDFENTYQQYKKYLPLSTSDFYDRFLAFRFLYDYDTFEGIERTLKGLEKRVKTDIPLSKAVIDLKGNYLYFETSFVDFFKIRFLQRGAEK